MTLIQILITCLRCPDLHVVLLQTQFQPAGQTCKDYLRVLCYCQFLPLDLQQKHGYIITDYHWKRFWILKYLFSSQMLRRHRLTADKDVSCSCFCVITEHYEQFHTENRTLKLLYVKQEETVENIMWRSFCFEQQSLYLLTVLLNNKDILMLHNFVPSCLNWFCLILSLLCDAQTTLQQFNNLN